jgi:streptomycin 6-kinase
MAIGDRGELALPGHLLDNLRQVHGRRVDAWLTGLPETLATILNELDARIEPGEPPLSYHLVFFARQADGCRIVIKCTVPNDDQTAEVAAVNALSDAGIGPHLLWSDLERGAMAMARVLPGDMLPRTMPAVADDAVITRTMATLARRMAETADATPYRDVLVPVRQYTRAIDEVDPASAFWARHHDDIVRARELRDAMLAAPDQPAVFLHGDLQHHNVLLDADAGHRVIDPKGLIGPAGYDFGALTYNPPYIQDHAELAEIERQRVDIWSEVTELPWETVRSWGYIGAVLSACWSGKGGAMRWRDAMKVADVMRDL